MKLTTNKLGVLIIVTVIIGISFSIATNYWATESSKTPKKLESGVGYDPGDIRGSYSFTDVANAFDISLDELKYAFSIPDRYDISTFKNKDLEGLYSLLASDIEIGNGSVKMFISLYTDLPYDYKSEGDYIPLKAYDLLESNGLIPENDKAYILNHTLDISKLNRSEPQVGEGEVVHEEKKINKNTTFKELLDMGIEKKSIVHIIGGNTPHR